jgi:hypothetical protein
MTLSSRRLLSSIGDPLTSFEVPWALPPRFRGAGPGPCRGAASQSSWLARFPVLLNEGCLQTIKTVALERAPPRKELLLGELITMQG